MPTNDVRAIGRATQGVRLIDVRGAEPTGGASGVEIESEDRVVSVARLVEKEDEDAPPDA